MILQQTPIMNEGELKNSQRLSLEQIQPPSRIPGYKMERFLGRGAFGEVWMAQDTNSGRKVAIKFFRVKSGFDWSMLNREVDKLQHLFSDRYVVQLLKIGWDAQPAYFVAEYMEQGSLEEKLQHNKYPIEEIVSLVREITEGLVHIHGKGILHCDLKPANILFDGENRPRIADFGQSRLSGDQSGSLGTLFYMAPEQADPKAKPDVQWDVYALGAILYRMLTGHLPFETDQFKEDLRKPGSLEQRLAIYRKAIKEAPPPEEHRQALKGDAALARIVDRCLSRNRRHRYANLQAVLEALEQREVQKTQRPLQWGGVLGSLLLMSLLFLFARWGFVKAVDSSEKHLLQRTVETNQNAAGNISHEVGLQIDQYWRILEEVAGHARLREILTVHDEELAAPLENDEIREVWLEKPGRQNLQAWLEKKSEQFQKTTNHVNISLLAADGRQLARVPPLDHKTIGKNWAFRDYFHGQGKDMDEGTILPPIQEPHLSNIFRSKAQTQSWGVAFSVPIWSEGEGEGEVLGVLMMIIEVRQFKLASMPHRWVVLFDTRPASFEGSTGAILGAHSPSQSASEEEDAAPAASDDAALETTMTPHLVHLTKLWMKAKKANGHQTGKKNLLAGIAQSKLSPEALSSRLETALAEKQIGATDQSLVLYGNGFVMDENEDPGPHMMALDTVTVHRTGNRIYHTGWGVLVQIDRQTALAPVNELKGDLFFLGGVGLVLVLLALAAIWLFVLIVLNPTSNVRWVVFLRRRLNLPIFDTATASGVSVSSSPSGLSGEQGRPSSRDSEKKNG
jgi:serine/threonine protein kinase